MNSLSATYSPEDNKLRLYSVSRLDTETYNRVKAAGFAWAPKQELFVAPMWTPAREDLLLELCDEIGDEDSTLVDRAEERADRFENYSDRRTQDAHSAHAAVDRIANGIPLGQPILVGHHSERHARKDAQRIENGMRKAVKMWDTANYWTSRAEGALRHAKYKELPTVRARRIKTLEAALRKSQRDKKDAETSLAVWTSAPLTHEQALYIAGRTSHGHLTLPRKEGDREDFSQCPTAYCALSNNYPELYAPRTVEDVIETARRVYPRTIAWAERWISHYENRIAYEKAMLNEQGAADLLKPKAKPALLPICNYRQEVIQAENPWSKGELENFPQIEMTSAEYAAFYSENKGTRTVDNSHRVRVLSRIIRGACHRNAVFITDSKVHAKPEPGSPKQIILPEPRMPRTDYTPPARTPFDDMKDALREGVKVVAAPQLFPTPPTLAEKVAEAAGIEPGHDVLEPSAGTGNLLDAIKCKAHVHAIEINPQLCRALKPREYCSDASDLLSVDCADFLSVEPGTICPDCVSGFDRIIMNPPFVNGADIAHIRHAIKFLKPGGRLVAICANGPRQQSALRPLAEDSGGYWEDLPAGSFEQSGTGVNTALVVIEA